MLPQSVSGERMQPGERFTGMLEPPLPAPKTTGGAMDPMQPWKAPEAAKPAETAEKAAESAASKTAEKFAGPSGANVFNRVFSAAGKSAVGGAASEVGGLAGPAGGAAAGAVAPELLAALGPVSIGLGALAVATGAAVVGIKGFVDTLSVEAKKIEDYSPDVSYADAQNDVRQSLAMQRRAEAVGPQLGQFQNDMGRLNEAMADVWTEMLQVLLDFYSEVRPAVEVGTDTLKAVLAGFQELKAMLDDWRSWNEADSEEEKAEDKRVADAHLKTLKAIKAIFEENEKKDEIESDIFLMEIQGMMNALRGRGGPGGGGGFVGGRGAKAIRSRTPRLDKGAFGV
jgi:hypothetical protein